MNAAVVPLRAADDAGDGTVGTIVILEDITRPRSAGGAAADLREDGVNRPACGRRRPRGQYAADRHLELHADAARGRGSGGSTHAAAREDRAADVPRGEDRQRAADAVASGRSAPDRTLVDLNVVVGDVLGLLEHQFELHRIKVRRELSDEVRR